ncbi:hypothetical protein HZA97_02915 [Candidatus Woesearchaeota archaeon]|nr:hypothetical protein [Candidatus Woesearchaeota archaeon]
MKRDELILYGLLVIVIVGFFFTLNSYFSNKTVNQPLLGAAELSSKCTAPPGYSQEQWTEHMGHHPDQYAECLGTAVQQQQQQQQTTQLNDAKFAEAMEKAIPKGVPDKYGSELGVSFEDPVNSMQVLGSLEDQIPLSDSELKRYISIASKISCEFCCGAQSIIDRKGNPACGCAHSGAMRGLGKYLVKNHGSEYTDDQILGELQKWKTMFFPREMVKRFAENGRVW